MRELTIKEKQPVFIIGSGFSKDLEKFPTLNDLSKDIIKKLNKGPERALWNEILNKIPKKIVNNIEWLLSYLYNYNSWQDKKCQLLNQALFNHISELIGDYFYDLENGTHRQCDNNNFKKILEYWHRNESTVITFNYDTLLEKYAEKFLNKKAYDLKGLYKGCPISVNYLDESPLLLMERGNIDYIPTKNVPQNKYYLSLRSRNEISKIDEIPEIDDDIKQIIKKSDHSKKIHFSHLYDVPVKNIFSRDGSAVWGSDDAQTFRLLKLHGSINWLYSGETEYSGEDVYYTLVQSHYKKTKPFQGLIPFIVPPVLAKDLFYKNRTLKTQWLEAAKAIAGKISDIIFIGYSLPETDLATNMMLTDALNQTQNKVYVLVLDDEDRKETETRYKKIVFDQKRLEFIHFSDSESSIQKLVEFIEL